jgi:hypothetical protein
VWSIGGTFLPDKSAVLSVVLIGNYLNNTPRKNSLRELKEMSRNLLTESERTHTAANKNLIPVSSNPPKPRPGEPADLGLPTG